MAQTVIGGPGLGGDARPRPGRADYALVALLIALAAVVVSLGVARGPSLSAFDEATHLDYVWKLAHGDVPFAGDPIAPEVLAEWSCRSQDNIPEQIPVCGGEHSPSAYPGQGQNYNFFHPPLYYAVSAAAVRVAAVLPVEMSFVTVARLVGGLWLAAALVGLYGLLRAWSVPRAYAAAGAAVVAAIPSVAHAASTVNNDGAAVLSGVVGLWILTRVVRQERLGWLLPTAATILVASTKVINAVAVLAVALVLFALAVAHLRRGRRRLALRLLVLVVGLGSAVAAVYVGWEAVQGGRGIPGWKNPIAGFNTSPLEGAPWDEWLPTLSSTLGLSQDFFLQASLAGAGAIAVARGLSVLLTAAPFANLAVFEARDPRRLVGWASLVGALAVPLLVQVTAYVTSASYFPRVNSRYGMALIPITIAALVLVAHARGWMKTSVAVAAVCASLLIGSFMGIW